ncbi:MAG TPA: SdpI family protein [Anaerolineae bacterium]|nr:SdpI family protein [Anaerolineae bacterium]HNU04625.1 SdpI family protein [Anaerolineae bacterium]
METILILYVVFGLLLAIFAVPLIRRKVKPNWIYGFRVPQTMSDPEVWYAVNAHFGRRLLVIGVATTLAALLLYRVPSLDVDSYAWALLAVFTLFFGVGLAQSWRYMKSLDKGAG